MKNFNCKIKIKGNENLNISGRIIKIKSSIDNIK